LAFESWRGSLRLILDGGRSPLPLFFRRFNLFEIHRGGSIEVYSKRTGWGN
ncbi:unnamed protein product, partial [Musa hybrid cultivar]